MGSDDVITVELNESTVRELKSIRKHPGQTYGEVIEELISMAKGSRNSQIDEILQRIQQAKMMELLGQEEQKGPENN